MIKTINIIIHKFEPSIGFEVVHLLRYHGGGSQIITFD